MFLSDKGKEIELSVIIPVYNVAPYLARCLDSIINQTYYIDEIICVNDGSTDNSLAILEEYASKDDRIVIVNKENGGLVSARKAGAVMARGKYVTSVDSDDWVESNMYYEMMQIAKINKCDIITSGCIKDYGSHSVVENDSIKSGFYCDDGLVRELQAHMISTDKFFKSNISMHIYGKIYRRELYVKYQMKVNDRINIADDAAVTYPCILNAKSVFVTGKSYYHYCMRSDSTLGKKKDDEMDRCQILFDGLEKEMVSKKDIIPNILKQFLFLKYFVLLLKSSEYVIKFVNDNLFPFGDIKNNDKIIIYGAGRFGLELESVLKKNNYCNIVGIADKVCRNGIMTLEDVCNTDYDKIIIAVLVYDIAEQIYRELINSGIGADRIYMVNSQLLV